MSDEIKEILDDLLFTTTLPNASVKLNKEKLNQLKDYITNLQEENERLKEYRESYKKELDFWRIQFSNKEERINKAIEYIEKSEGNRAYRIVESISENNEEQAIDLLNKIENRAHLTELEVKLYNQINKIDEILKNDYITMNIVVNDLKETLKVNNYIKQGENELICLDVDHINYLISTLEGKDKNDL